MPSKRRLFGIDRSGPLRRGRRAAARRCTRGRSRTWSATCGWRRSRSSSSSPSTRDDGRALAPALIYLAISAGDYLDGFLARATGQYSRMGALLDPVVDRLDGARRGGGLLALRAAAALGAGRARGPRAGHARARPAGAAPRDRHRGQLDRPDRRLPRLRGHLLEHGPRLVDHPRPGSCSGSRSRSSRPSSTSGLRSVAARSPRRMRPAPTQARAQTLKLNLKFADQSYNRR